MNILVVLVGVLVAGAVALLVYGLGKALSPGEEVEERLERWVAEGDDSGRDAEGSGALLGRVERGITGRDFATGIRDDLAQADLPLTVSEYLLIRGGAVVVLVVLGYLVQRNLLVAGLFGVAGIFLPTIYVRMRQGQRLKAFGGQLPDVLDHLVGSLRAGYGLLQAVEWVGHQIPPPAGDEFERVIREVQLGRSLLDALDSMVRRIPSDDLSLIVTAIKIQYEVGGHLADILETVAHTIRERVRIQREIGVLTAQQRYSGYVLMFMPIALAFVLFLINPEYEMQLFAPGPTLCIPIGTGIMMVVGFFVMRRIVDIEV
ncbi:MAG: type II secretion system F family protein [Anaerolineae bacterium]|jgi:tight adherence protein B